MKIIIFIAVITLAAADLSFYNFFEDLDMNTSQDNEQKYEELIDCVLDKGPCTDLQDSYKDLFSAAVKEKCHRCTPYQKYLFLLFLEAVEAKSPEKYLKFKHKFDPKNTNFDALMLELNHQGIVF